MKNYTMLGIGCTLLCLSIFSCQKPGRGLHPQTSDTSTTMARTSVLTYRLASDISSVSESNLAMLTKQGIQLGRAENKVQSGSIHGAGTAFTIPSHFIGFFGDSVTYTPEGINTPGIITSDFGPAAPGKSRSGKLINYFYHGFADIGFKDSINFQKFNVLGYLVNGSIVMTRLTASSFSRTFNLNYSYKGGPVNQYIATGIRYYSIDVVKPGDMMISSVTYTETGTVNGQNGIGGISVTGTIINPLKFSKTCAITGGIIPVAGTIDLKTSLSAAHSIIDFGNGSCDLIFTITIGGVIKTVNLADLADTHL